MGPARPGSASDAAPAAASAKASAASSSGLENASASGALGARDARCSVGSAVCAWGADDRVRSAATRDARGA